MNLISYTTNTEFITRELHSTVDDPALYNWDEIWYRLRIDTDAILYDSKAQGFRWNDKSDYMQNPGALIDLVDSYALDRTIIEERYVAGKLWTRRITLNAATGYTRRITYSSDVHVVSAVCDADGTRYAKASIYDGKPLRGHDVDTALTESEKAWRNA